MPTESTASAAPAAAGIEETSQGLIVHDGKGGSREYRSEAIRSLEFRVTTLQVKRGSTIYFGSDAAPPVTHTYITAHATLIDRGLEVIGMPESQSTSVELTIHSLTGGGPPDPADAETGAPARHSGVFLSYNVSDWEIGDRTGWWCEVRFDDATFGSILQSIERREMQSLTVSIRMRGLLTTDYYAPASMSINWYLPKDKEGRIRMANGYVSSYQAVLASADFRPAASALEAEENDESVPVVPPDPVAFATMQLGASVERLRTTVRWMGALVVFALLMLVFK